MTRRPPKPPPVEPVANAWILRVLVPLRAILVPWPAVLPEAVGEPIRPLKIGAADALTALLPADDSGAGQQALDLALRRYGRSRQYRAALAAPAARHDLAGQPVAPVAAEDKDKPPGSPAQPPAVATAVPVPRTKETFTVTVRVKAFKVTAAVPPGPRRCRRRRRGRRWCWPWRRACRTPGRSGRISYGWGQGVASGHGKGGLNAPGFCMLSC